MDDWQLLQNYAKRGSEESFRALVDRHLPLVHAAALRQVHDPHLAEEVTQAVFVLLAQKAPSLRAGVLLPGWLFRTTRFVAARAARSERRRHEREWEAFEMEKTETSNAADSRLSPMLDEALMQLHELDRHALLLRFAQERTLREIGQELGMSEEATRKRVNRALERLRVFFTRRGFTVTSAVVAAVLSRRLVAAPPEGFASSIAAKSMVGGRLGHGSKLSGLEREAWDAWRWSKFRAASGLVVSLLGLGFLGFVLFRPSPTPHRFVGGGAAVANPSPQSRAQLASPAKAAAFPRRSRERLIRFHVVAQNTGEPIAQAPLAVNSVTGQGWKQRFDLLTDASGTAEVPYRWATDRLDVGVLASGWAARFATWRTDLDSEIPGDYTIRLHRVTTPMGGWLRDEKGRPVANAVIQMEFGGSDMAQEENPRERPGFPWPAPVARSDRNGRWSCAVVDSSAKRTPAIRALHSGFAPAEITSWSSRAEPSAAQSRLWKGDLVTILHPGLRLLGKVTDEQDRPVSGAEIVHKPSSSDLLQAETDGGGWFAFQGLPSADFDFIVTAPGFAQQYASVAVRDGMPTAKIRLAPGGLLRLHLVDENEVGLAGVSVGLTGFGGMYSPSSNWKGESDFDGRIEWTSAPQDEFVNLCAWKLPEFSMTRGIMVKADGQEHVIHLNRAFAVSGRVVDARTSALFRGEIKVFPGYGEGEYCWYRGETRRTTNGLYHISFDEQGSPVRLRIEADGYVPFVSEALSVKPGVCQTLDVVLRPLDPSSVVRGTIWRTDGQLAAGAEVALLSPEHGASLGRACFAERSSSDQLIVNTDASGAFSFPFEPGASAIMAVCSNGFARVPLSVDGAPLDVRLHPWGRIEGQIDPTARTRPIAYVEMDDLLALNSPGPVRLDRRSFNQKATEDGRFSFEFVPAGSFCLWLDAGVIEDPQVPAFHHATWVQVNSGETAAVTVVEKGVRVKGRFVMTGAAAEPASLPRFAMLESAWPPSSPTPGQSLDAKQWINTFLDPGRLLISPDGRFESRIPIPPGRYRLRGKIGSVVLDQPMEVPLPELDVFRGDTAMFESGPGTMNDLGDIPVTVEQALSPP